MQGKSEKCQPKRLVGKCAIDYATKYAMSTFDESTITAMKIELLDSSLILNTYHLVKTILSVYKQKPDWLLRPYIITQRIRKK